MEPLQERRVSRAARPPAAFGRWGRDARSPSLRLTPPPVPLPPPDVTAPFPVIGPEERSEAAPAQAGRSRREVVQLRPIRARETMPFLGRVSACPYLECRPSTRRCLSADPAPVSLERQVRYCLGDAHRTCKYYRKARGLPAVPPTQAAYYTAAAVVLAMLIVLAGLA